MSTVRLIARGESVEDTETFVKVDDRPGTNPRIEEDDERVSSVSNVQFTCPIFYGEKSTGEVELEVIRIRALDTHCRVRYTSREGSARAGTTFKHTEGELVFEPGEYLKSISVPFLQSELWSATTEFSVVLAEPEACVLGKYLYLCRIKVVDDNVFPSNRFREAVETGDLEDVGGFSLFWAYARWNVVTAALVKATVLTLIFDQLSNVYKIMITVVDMYMVNTVLASDRSEEDFLLFGSRYRTVCFVAGLHFFPWFLIYGWLWARNHLDVMNISSQHLQKMMYRKYMNFSPQQIETLRPEILEFGLLTEAPVVASGYDAGLTLFQKFFNVLMNVYLVACSRMASLPIVGLVALTVMLWALWRERYEIPVVKEETTLMTHLVKEAAGKHDMICRYQIRPEMNHRFELAAQSLRGKLGEQCNHIWTTNFVLSLVAPFFVAAYMVRNVQFVLDGDLRLGTFLGIIKIINTVASESCSAYQTFGRLVHTFHMLRNVTGFFNKPTEVRPSMDYNRARRRRSRELLAGMGKANVDELPIYCEDLSFSFGHVTLLDKVSLRVPQGSVVGIHGPNSSGKNMFLRLLARAMKESGGSIFVPSHLRVLLVAREPLFMDAPLITNLTLGAKNVSKADVQRLQAIMLDLELPKLAKVLEAEYERRPPEGARDEWSGPLSLGYKTRVALARAFFMNPELMLLQRPLAMYEPSVRARIKGLMMDHARHKGLHLEEKTISLRRPRTVIFTSDTSDRCRGSDMICEVLPSGRKNVDGDPIFSLRICSDA